MKKILSAFLILLLISQASYATIDQQLRNTLKVYPDFPKAGIQFADISPVLANPEVFHAVIDAFAEKYADQKIDVIMGLDSRGFIFGAALAYKLKKPFVMARKPGKLPGETISAVFSKEYGQDSLAIQRGAVKPGNRVLIVDDLIATGGTALAAQELVKKSGGTVVGLCALIELQDILAANKGFNMPVYALLKM